MHNQIFDSATDILTQSQHMVSYVAHAISVCIEN